MFIAQRAGPSQPVIPTTARNLGAAVLVFFLATHADALAQDASLRVALGTDTGMPGGTVIIPLSIANPQQLRIGTVSVDVEFPRQLLKWKAARASLAAETAGAKIKADELASSQSSDATVIRVLLAAKRPLPNGTLASLELSIAERIEKISEIPLKIKTIALLTLDGKKVGGAGADGGKITVSESPPTLVNCFFFTH